MPQKKAWGVPLPAPPSVGTGAGRQECSGRDSGENPRENEALQKFS